MNHSDIVKRPHWLTSSPEQADHKNHRLKDRIPSPLKSSDGSVSQAPQWRNKSGSSSTLKTRKDLIRYELKYLIPIQLVPRIRAFIEPFCEPDKNGRGTPPSYTNTTLQLDSSNLTLHRAKQYDSLSRFKLRARVYHTRGDHPVILEIKRKLGANIVKSRAIMLAQHWADFCGDERGRLPLWKESHRPVYREFIRLVREIDARPVILVRYEREAYLSTIDTYARVTFDHKLRYQTTRSWLDWGSQDHWRVLDSGVAFGRRYPCVVMELKSTHHVPRWMVDLVQQFNLVRSGFCKYSTAVRLEGRYQPESWSQFETSLY